MRWAALAAAVLFMTGAASAQSSSSAEQRETADLLDGNAGLGIQAGDFTLYPTLEIIYRYETNLFLTPPEADAVASSVYVARPKLHFEMFSPKISLRTGYKGEYRAYESDAYSPPERWTHLLYLDASAKTASRLSFFVKGRYARSVFYTEIFDPNREVQVGKLPFTQSGADAGLMYRIHSRAEVELFGGVKNVRFDEEPGVTRNFHDYSASSTGVRGNFHLTPLTRAFLEAERTVSERDRAYQGLADGLRTVTTAVRGGVGGSLLPTMSGSVFAGYKISEYDNASGSASEQSEFRGLIYGLQIQNSFSPRTKLAAGAWREENQSAVSGNNYYVSTVGTATLTHQISRGLFASLGLSYQRSVYENAAALSVSAYGEDIYGVRGGVGFYFSERASVRANYQHRVQNADIASNDYRASFYTLQAQIGW